MGWNVMTCKEMTLKKKKSLELQPLKYCSNLYHVLALSTSVNVPELHRALNQATESDQKYLFALICDVWSTKLVHYKKKYLPTH